MSFHQSITFDKDTATTFRPSPNTSEPTARGVHFEQSKRPGAGEDGTIWVKDAKQMRRLANVILAEAKDMELREAAAANAKDQLKLFKGKS